MRLSVLPLLAALLGATPVLAQQISPMTGTTTDVPSVPPPSAIPVPNAAPAAAPHHRARQGRQTLQHRFEAANTSHDGKLTLEQARTGKMTRVAQNFDAIDTAKKGYVTMDDIHAWNRAQAAARKLPK